MHFIVAHLIAVMLWKLVHHTECTILQMENCVNLENPKQKSWFSLLPSDAISKLQGNLVFSSNQLVTFVQRFASDISVVHILSVRSVLFKKRDDVIVEALATSQIAQLPYTSTTM